MVSKRVVAAVFFSSLLAAAALAQSAVPASSSDATIASPDEFHASGGEIDVLTKRPSQFSGSFSLGVSNSSLFGTGRNYNANIGGTLVKDKVWFFASGQQGSSIASRFAPAIQQNAKVARAIDTNFFAQLGDRQTLSATASSNRDAGLTTAGAVSPFNSSFMSLHYTGVISPNSFFTASVSRSVVK